MFQQRITSKRQAVQFLLIAVALIVPFVSISGNPFLRMDIARMTLFLAGIPLRIDQFYLVLLVALLSVVGFLLLTAILGRVWCGWLCPQTVFNDLLEVVQRRFSKKLSGGAARFLEHFTSLVIAKLIAFNLFCWFMSPVEAATDLFHFTAHPVMFATFVVLVLSGYLNLILVKRSFCRSYCPYGRFQAALMDSGTLNLSFMDDSGTRCLRCKACVRTCPMGIDIRDGFQIECIGCGRCIDACRDVMERTSDDGGGLIDYRFGIVKGTKFKAGTITVVLSMVTILLAVALVWGLVNRSQSAFALQRVATAEPRQLPDGTTAVPWRAIIGNRSESPRQYELHIAGADSGVAELLGPVKNIDIKANQHREVIFMLHLLRSSKSVAKVRVNLTSDGKTVATVDVSP